jgi:uncharacterized YccA/Bax inhibitor family protein
MEMTANGLRGVDYIGVGVEGGTIALAPLLLAYRSGLIRATEKFKRSRR